MVDLQALSYGATCNANASMGDDSKSRRAEVQHLTSFRPQPVIELGMYSNRTAGPAMQPSQLAAWARLSSY